MKKTIVALVLALALIVPSFGMAAAYTAGTYEAEAQGFSSAVKVSVTVSESEITALTVDCSGDTPGIGAAAGEPMVEAILAAQATREERLAAAADVIDNSGDESSLDAPVAELHRRYLAMAAARLS